MGQVNQTKIDNAIRKTKDINIDMFKNSFVIIPYQHSGVDTYTNSGIKDGVRNPIDFETFKQIWTGNDACVLCWKNSTRLYQDSTTKNMKIAYQLGDYFLGEIEGNTRTIDISKDKSFHEYTTQQSEVSVTFRVSETFNIDNTYDYMFFKIPELYGSMVFRIDTIDRDYFYDDFKGYRITFKSINQDYANTGRARQQNVMPNSPGQGYIEAIVKDANWPNQFTKEEWDELVNGVDYIKLENGKYITADFQKTLNRPVKKVVVKCFGAGIISSFTMIGRKARYGGNLEEYGIPRAIFPINFQSPTTPTLYRSQSEVQNFYFGEFSPSVMYIKEVMQQAKDMMSPINKWENQGVLLIDESDLRRTNPSSDYKTNFRYTLYGNQSYDEEGNKIYNPWVFYAPEHQLSDLGQQGVDNPYTIGGEKAIHDHMFDNYWTQKNMKTLPISVYSALGFGWTVGSSLGAFVTKQWWLGISLFTIGLAASLIQWAITPTFKYFRGIISADLVELNNQYGLGAGVNDKLSFNILQSNSEDNPSSVFFDGSTMCTGFEAELTDLFYDKKEDLHLDTTNIGQSTYENGSQILEGGFDYLLNGDEQLEKIDDNEIGFIIDKFQLQGCFNGEFSVEFKDVNDEVVWSGFYQSEGKWANSLREIWTEKNVSVFGRENTFFSKPIPYPKQIPEAIYGNAKLPRLDFTTYTNKSFTNADVIQRGINIGYIPKSFFTENRPEEIYDFEIFKYTDLINNFRKFKQQFQNIVVYQRLNTSSKFRISEGFGTKDVSINIENNIQTNKVFDMRLELDTWFDFEFPFEEKSNKITNSIRVILGLVVAETILKKVSIMFYEENGYLKMRFRTNFDDENLFFPNNEISVVSTGKENLLNGDIQQNFLIQFIPKIN